MGVGVTERRGASRGQRGQSIAEFVLLLPLLLLILMGCLDLGRAFAVWVCLTNGTREGARLVSIHPGQLTEAHDLTTDYIVAEGWSADSLTVAVSKPVGGGGTMAVTASYRMPLVTLVLFGGEPVTISARTQMQVIPS